MPRVATLLPANPLRESGGMHGINQVTHQILGCPEQQFSSQSSFILSATFQ